MNYSDNQNYPFTTSNPRTLPGVSWCFEVYAKMAYARTEGRGLKFQNLAVEFR